MEIKDIENPEEEFRKLTPRFRLLRNRFLAIAMDYKHYIEYSMEDLTIYRLRDNTLFRLYNAQFHLQLLLEHHPKIESRLQNLYEKTPSEILQNGFKFLGIKMQSEAEVYSLFDSMIYHLCSIYDYLFRLVNFAHGKEILTSPKWNRYRDDKNLKNFIYCSKEIFPKLKELDETFVYPLYQHRSYLIHNESDVGPFNLRFKLGGDNFNSKFYATKQFINNFPELQKENEIFELTIKYVAFWLIDKTIKTTTEILFEVRDDMIRNKKNEHGMHVIFDENNAIKPLSTPLWGDRNIT